MVVAPSFFGNIELGSIPAQEEKMLIGRVVEATLYDITGDFSHHYLKMFFQTTPSKAKQQEPSLKATNTHVTS
jgi:small subunit ribosomal protein S3Ae